MRMVQVAFGDRTYSILIGRGLLSRLGSECRQLELGERAAIISDRNVAAHYAPGAERSLREAGFNAVTISVAAGETAKTLANVQRCYDLLAAHRLERGSFV